MEIKIGKKGIMLLVFACMLIIGLEVKGDKEVSAAVTKNLTTAQVVSAANSRVGQKYPNNLCLKWVADFWSSFGATRSSANCASEYANSHVLSTSISNIPIGADVFFENCGGRCSSCKNYAGHIGVYVGNGYFVHATAGKVQKSMVLSWKKYYRGWGYHSYIRINNDSAPVRPPVTKTYSIDNVRIASIDASHVTIAWSTTNLPRSCMVVKAGNKTYKSGYAVGKTSVATNTFSATFNRSSILNCPRDVNILIYAYSSTSGPGQNETLHRVTYGSSITGVLVFPAKADKCHSDYVPSNMLSRGTFSGWIISDSASVANVCITVNGKKLYAKLGTRPDVSKVYPSYKYVKGYSLTISPYYIKDGNNNSYSVVANLTNGKSYTIKSGTFMAKKVSSIYDDEFFKMRYASNSYINKLKTPEEREKFFYDNLNNKFSDGYTKDYLCGSMVCDLGYYYSANKDLSRLGWNGYQIYDHFINYGIKSSGGKEYRVVSPWVSLSYLHNTYRDLKGMTPEQLINWAGTYGVKLDHRLLANTNAAKAYKNFYNCRQYASRNSDLVRAFSRPVDSPVFSKTGCNKYWNHLLNYGIKEKRKISNNFDCNKYCKNAGLSPSATPWQIFHHYYSYGYAKGIKTK